MRLGPLILGLVGTASPVRAQVADSGVAIPMRDGVILRATILRPSTEGRFPVLVYRTPYSQAAAVSSYTFKSAVRRRYAVVAQDVRGRYLSDGEFDPYRQEGKDGYDTIEWAASQPWSTGEVGTFGLSYPGAVQWLAAIEAPPHLKAMVPAMTFSRPTNFWYAGRVADLSWPAWIWPTSPPTLGGERGFLVRPPVARLEPPGVRSVRRSPTASQSPMSRSWTGSPPGSASGTATRPRIRGGIGPI